MTAAATTTPSNNRKLLLHAQSLQQDTKDALHRIQTQTFETEIVAEESLLEMLKQRAVLEQTSQQADRLLENQTRAHRKLNRLDRWAGRVGGIQKRRAKKAARKERKAAAATAATTAATAKVAPEPQSGEWYKDSTTTGSSAEAVTNSISLQTKKKTKTIARGRTVPRQTLLDETKLNGVDDDDYDLLHTLEENDQEIDQLLDDTAQAVGRLARIGNHLEEETKTQNKVLGKVTNQMEEAADEQAFLNQRAKVALGGRGKIRRRWGRQ